MGYYNVPDDWDSYYRNCERCDHYYHASEGDCDCDLPDHRVESDRMSSAGYDYEGEGRWEKLVCRTVHTARRDHKDGTIKAGEQYAKYTYRTIDFDDDGDRGHSSHRHFKRRRVLTTTEHGSYWKEVYCD
jgi:hypothetical protein